MLFDCTLIYIKPAVAELLLTVLRLTDLYQEFIKMKIKYFQENMGGRK